MAISIAVDLGSTLFKAAVLTKEGELTDIISSPFPQPVINGLIYEADADECFKAANEILKEIIKKVRKPLPVGIASQRSSFLLWDKATGKPETALISWQDRRAESWCRQKSELNKSIWRNTGLKLLPYYLGPKLAVILEEDVKLRKGLESGELLFGTLDTYLIWKWTDKKVFQTDPTMAARTLLFDIHRNCWSEENIRNFNLPLNILPEIMPSKNKNIILENGFFITSSVADQTAAIYDVLGENAGSVMVNLGTGGFVIKLSAKIPNKFTGYLVSPGPLNHDEKLYAIEGTINGLNRAIGLCLPNMPELGNNSTMEGFCIPDCGGVGAPHWKTDWQDLIFSKEAEGLTGTERAVIILEGIIFRINEIIEGLFESERPVNIFLSGGNSEINFIKYGLASCMSRPVNIVAEKECTLKGAGKLAKKEFPSVKLKYTVISPKEEGQYLYPKYLRWRKWVKSRNDVLSF